MANTVPDSHENRLMFFLNLKAQATAKAAALGWDATKTAAVLALIQPLVDKYQTLVDAEHAVTAATADAEETYATQKAALLAFFEELRANPLCTAAMAAEMNINPGSSAHDPSQTKPSLKLTPQPGHVRVTGSKDYAELINIYMRRVGQTTWTLVGIRRKKFPFDDQTPLAQAGVPEAREYMGRGVIGDEEVGLPSDIVPVVFAG